MKSPRSLFSEMPVDDRLAEIKKIWKPGMSAGQIAAALPYEVTRNSIIGLFHRYGPEWNARGIWLMAPRLAQSEVGKASKNRTKPIKATAPKQNGSFGPAMRARRKRKLAPIAAPIAMPVPRPDAPIPPPQGLMLKDLGSCQCRWPVNDLRDRFDVFLFCAEATYPGVSYCPAHTARARHPWNDRHKKEKAGAG